MNKNQNSFRSKIKGMLFHFSSEDFQMAAWTSGIWEGNKVIYTPDEFTCMWFDDTFRNVEQLIENGKLNKKEWSIILPFHEFFKENKNKFREENIPDPMLLFNYESWREMRKRAKETLNELDKIGWDKIPITEESL